MPPQAQSTAQSPPKPTTDPEKYTNSDHFNQRLKQQGRYITRNEVNQIIRNGTWKHEERNWKVTATISGLQYTAIISDHKTEIVTAYIAITNKEKAHTNPQYTTEQINTMHIRTQLAWNKEKLTTQFYKNITINTPFTLRGHTVNTPKNHITLQCTQCGLTAHKKQHYAQTNCQQK